MQSQVSVITSTTNRLKLLRETMDSLAAQSFDSWEHLVVDDGSDDGTAEEVMARAAADSRVRYIQRTGDKAGANVCRNLGVAQSRADLIVFLDSDDLLRTRCLEDRVQTMSRNPSLDFAVFRAGVFNNAVGDLGRLYHPMDPGDNLLRFLSHECVWEISGPIWRRGFLEQIGCFDESLLSMQDLELHVRALSARARYLCFSAVDHDIRWQHDDTKTSVRHYYDPTYIEAAERVRSKLLETVSCAGLLTWSRKRAILGLSFETSASWAHAKRLGRAVRGWSQGCHEQGAPAPLKVGGILMLCLARVSAAPNGICSRLVNKWKGLVRFRQEPALLPGSDNHSAKARAANTSDCPA